MFILNAITGVASNVIRTVGTVPLAFAVGLTRGTVDGCSEASITAGSTKSIIDSVKPEYLDSLFGKVETFVRKYIGEFFSGGIKGIEKSGIGAEMSKLGQANELKGLGEGLRSVGSKLIGSSATAEGVGLRGLALIGLGGAAAVGGIIAGGYLAYTAYSNFGRIRRGFEATLSGSSLLEVCKGASGLTMLAGGIALLGGAPVVGIGALVAGGICALGLSKGEQIACGPNMFTLEETAPYGIGEGIRAIKNRQFPNFS